MEFFDRWEPQSRVLREHAMKPGRSGSLGPDDKKIWTPVSHTPHATALFEIRPVGSDRPLFANAPKAAPRNAECEEQFSVGG